MTNQSTKLLNHCVKGAQMGIVALGCMLPYCKGRQTYEFVQQSANKYQKYVEDKSALLQTYHENAKHVNKISVFFASKTVRWRCKRHGSDGSILSQVRDGAVKSVDACERYMKMYAGASQEAIAAARELKTMGDEIASGSTQVKVD